MSEIDATTVRRIAHLARLRLTDAEIVRLTADLSGIVEYVHKLAELNTKHVPPTAHPLAIANVFRDDHPQPCVDVEEALQNAPDRHGDFLRVPRVLDQETA
jgi:aspartyl-tRNA(Asn)/glutamyl-tRNA(Gln) amidotransferase subunit C